MLRKLYKPTLTLALCIAVNIVNAQNTLNKGAWRDVNTETVNLSSSAIAKNLKHYRLVELNLAATQNWLQGAPMEYTAEARSGNYIITLPIPTGEFKEFTIAEAPMMEQALADKYPSIKTYAAQGLQDKSMWAKIDVTPLGFHAMISSSNGVVFIDPVSLSNTQNYLVYYKHDLKNMPVFSCGVNETLEDVIQSTAELQQLNKIAENPANKTTGAEIQLRKYRLALAATGEYTKTKGGTVEGALAGQVVSMNRVNGVYETEVGIRMVIVGNNDKIVYVDANNDPYTNNNGSTMLNENVNNINKVIGSGNYDIGHVFSTGGGGIAGLGVPCGGGKARGVTGSPSPVGDAFDIDYVVHEMGHQFGGQHTFNSNTQGSCAGNRASTAAYEPGSGITIMAYAGICGSDDIALHSIPYFHAKSINEITTFSQFGTGNNCAQKQLTGNFPPTAIAGTARVIPKSTPFALKGSGSDPDGDAITYSWEEYDLGPQGSPNTPSGDAPIFRPFAPTPQALRVFPQWSDILAKTQTKGEILPSYARRMIFRLTVRDNKVGGGGTGSDTMGVQVISTAGPFKVTSQSTSETWNEGEKKYISWNVNSTDIAPINCSQVNIKLSLDGGSTYPITLVDSVPNSGMDSIIVPGVNTTQARIMVQAVGNIFFNINDRDIAINSSGFTLTSTNPKKGMCLTDTASYTLNLNQFIGFTDSIYLYADTIPSGASVLFSENDVPAPRTITVKVFNAGTLTPGNYPVKIKALSGSKSDSIVLKLAVFSAVPAAVTTTAPANNSINQLMKPMYTWDPTPEAVSYRIEISTDASFNNIVYKDSLIPGTTYFMKGTFALQGSTQYFWRALASNSCGKGAYSSVFNFTTRTSSPAAPATLTGSVVSSSEIDLNWVDKSNNEDGFIIYRSSTNGTSGFTIIDSVAANTTSYNNTGLAANTTFYYNVCAYNVGGKTCTNTINKKTQPNGIAGNNGSEELVRFYPNPVNTDKLNIEINSTIQGSFQYKIYDLTGRLVKQETFKNTGSVTVYSVNVSDFEQGLYLIKLTKQNGSEVIQKITVVK